MTIMSVLMLAYVLIKRPFTSTIGIIEVVLYELCIFITNILVLTMAIYDEQGQEMTNERETLGKVIITCFFIFSAVAIIFLVINIF